MGALRSRMWEGGRQFLLSSLDIHLSSSTQRRPRPSEVDAVWIYMLSFGGGLVSGDVISYKVTVEDGCSGVLATQASTKVYKSAEGKYSEQILEACLGRNSLLAVLPDPVTCFSNSRYSQKQVFNLVSDSNLVLVDWVTSGRHKRGEVWDFEMYRSSNSIYLNGNCPIFIDSTLLEMGVGYSVADRMQEFNVLAMLVVFGPKLEATRNDILSKVREKSESLCRGIYSTANCRKPESRTNNESSLTLFASCSVFGPMDNGLVVRIGSISTEAVYEFLRDNLLSIQPLIGASPYSR